MRRSSDPVDAHPGRWSGFGGFGRFDSLGDACLGTTAPTRPVSWKATGRPIRRRPGIGRGTTVDLFVEREINRPAGEVFEFFADAANNPRWQSGMKSCRWTSEPPIAVGSTYEQVAEFMGRPVRSVFEVTALEPGQLISIATIESTFPIQVTRSVESIDDDRCLVRARITGGPGGVLKVLSPLTDRLARRSIEADYDRLVNLLAG